MKLLQQEIDAAVDINHLKLPETVKFRLRLQLVLEDQCAAEWHPDHPWSNFVTWRDVIQVTSRESMQRLLDAVAGLSDEEVPSKKRRAGFPLARVTGPSRIHKGGDIMWQRGDLT
jgi:hypothetical protein